MVTKKLVSLRDYLSHESLQFEIDGQDPAGEDALRPACRACQGQGMLMELLVEGLLGVKAPRYRPFACPHYEKGQALAKQIWENRMKQSQLPKQYAQADLALWGDPKHPSRKGKVKAYLACRAMLLHPEHQVSSHAIAGYILKLFGKERPHWVDAVLQAPEDSRAGLMLWGDYGVGKTWLAAVTINALAQEREYVLYLRMSQLMQSLRDSWKGDERTGQLLKHYCEVPILFIDDMSDSSQDALPLPAYQQDYAAAIMRSRMGDKLPTLVTSNWNPDHFVLKWGRVCTEVLLEGLHWIEVGGERLRNVSGEREETL